MVYSNLISRFFVSIFFLFIYLLLSLIKFEYILFLALAIYLLIFYEVIINFIKLKLIISLYLIISLFFLYSIDFKQEFLVNFNLMILIIISFDIFSFFIGKAIGKNKIFGKISPNKTLEGLIGGICFSVLISVIYIYYFHLDFTYLIFIFVSLIIFSALLGDIIESYFKRKNNLKNSSSLLLGHGGFFDRFDSFILSIITYSIFYKII